MSEPGTLSPQADHGRRGSYSEPEVGLGDAKRVASQPRAVNCLAIDPMLSEQNTKRIAADVAILAVFTQSWRQIEQGCSPKCACAEPLGQCEGHFLDRLDG